MNNISVDLGSGIDSFTLSSGIALTGNLDITATNVTLASGVEAAQVNVNLTGVGKAQSVISGATNVTKSGTGVFTLSQANSYTGTTNVTAGMLIVSNNAGLGTATGGTNVSSGATLALSGGVTISNETITLDGTGTTIDTDGDGTPEVVSPIGALVNLDGNNVIDASASLEALVVTNGAMGLGSLAGTLTVNSGVDLKLSQISVAGDGNTAINGVISSSLATALNLSQLMLQDLPVDGATLDPLAFWQFDEGSGNTVINSANPGTGDGTFTSATYDATTARSGTSLFFDNNVDDVTINLSSGLLDPIVTNNQVTLSLWIYGRTADAGFNSTTVNGVAGSTRTVFAHIPHNNIIFITTMLNSLPGAVTETIEAVTMGMWPTFIGAVTDELPESTIVFDRFHIKQYLNKGVGLVRRQEHRQLTAVGETALRERSISG